MSVRWTSEMPMYMHFSVFWIKFEPLVLFYIGHGFATEDAEVAEVGFLAGDQLEWCSFLVSWHVQLEVGAMEDGVGPELVRIQPAQV